MIKCLCGRKLQAKDGQGVSLLVTCVDDDDDDTDDDDDDGGESDGDGGDEKRHLNFQTFVGGHMFDAQCH